MQHGCVYIGHIKVAYSAGTELTRGNFTNLVNHGSRKMGPMCSLKFDFIKFTISNSKKIFGLHGMGYNIRVSVCNKLHINSVTQHKSERLAVPWRYGKNEHKKDFN